MVLTKIEYKKEAKEQCFWIDVQRKTDIAEVEEVKEW